MNMSGTSEYMKLYDASSQYKNLTPKFESLKFPERSPRSL